MTNVEKYLEARAELSALERAALEEGRTPERVAKIGDAKARARIAYGHLTGGEIARVRRMAPAGAR